VSTQENKEVVRRFIGAMAAGDLKLWYSMISDDCDYWVQGVGKVTKQQIVDATDAFCAIFTQPIDMRPTGMIAEGEDVAVRAESYAPLKAGGEYKNTYHIFYTVRGGKIVAAREYLDTLHLSQTLAKVNVTNLL
jgi:uncharacterized protein